MQYPTQSVPFSQGNSFYASVMFYFGLAILASGAGTYVGFNYLVPLFLSNPLWMYLLFALELVLVFTSRFWSTKRPLNYLLFASFAFITGVTIVPLLASIILEFGGPEIIIKAFASTAFTFAGCAIFGWVTDRDLSGMRGFLYAALIGMIVISLIGIFIPWGSGFEIFFSGFGVVLFSGYTMYDLQRIKSMPHQFALDAALMLYLDIFNLFIYFLRLISGASRSR